jgi:hypothetical protein
MELNELQLAVLIDEKAPTGQEISPFQNHGTFFMEKLLNLYPENHNERIRRLFYPNLILFIVSLPIVSPFSTPSEVFLKL